MSFPNQEASAGWHSAKPEVCKNINHRTFSFQRKLPQIKINGWRLEPPTLEALSCRLSFLTTPLFSNERVVPHSSVVIISCSYSVKF